MNVLICEDNPATERLILRHVTSWGYVPAVVRDGPAALEAMSAPGAPGLILLDWELPGMSGLEVCRRFFEANRGHQAHVIIVTAHSSSSELVKALEAGAADYIRKPFDAAELRARMLAGRRNLELRAQLQEARRRMEDLAYLDELTRIPNRRAMTSHLERELGRAKRSGGLLSVGLVDIDNFKGINDSVGHPMGDRVLATFARLAQGAMRTTDLLGRWGGDEFLVLAPHGPGEQFAGGVSPVFDRVRHALAAVGREVPGLPCAPSASIGVVVAQGDENLERILAGIDRALYEAKGGGKDSVRLGTTPPPWQAGRVDPKEVFR